jgi:hypothetical protein
MVWNIEVLPDIPAKKYSEGGTFGPSGFASLTSVFYIVE